MVLEHRTGSIGKGDVAPGSTAPVLALPRRRQAVSEAAAQEMPQAVPSSTM